MAELAEADFPTYPDSSQFMRPFALGATAFLAGLTVLFIATRGRVQSPDHWSDLYLVLLAVYAGAGEVKQWSTPVPGVGESEWTQRLRKGGPLISLWLLITFGVGLWRIIDPSRPMPPELQDITMKVLGLFFGTYALRQYRQRGRRTASSAAAVEAAVRAQVRQTLTEKGPLSASALAEASGIPRRSLARELKEMVDTKELVREGRSATDPNAVYRLP
jgi:hypothetical protein